ncbi:hypothetical protein GCM10023149_37950 [Mucilaginibacter gynuensis]|uniref:Gliding motility-associated-like protein n=1 Tax=Mucilaginibacter gynuensis TaxID=1302236 RepID=A0ABP8GYU4_9SPHI
MKKHLLFGFVFVFGLWDNNVNAQAQTSPAITYPSSGTFIVGKAITPISPVNTGGAVYPSKYAAPALLSSYQTPFSLAVDAENCIYTTSIYSGNLSKLDKSGKVLGTVNTGDNQASGVGIDKAGNIYIAQFTQNSLLKYNQSGTLLAKIRGFSDPYGIAFDSGSNIYVANYFTGTIYRIKAGTVTPVVYLSGLSKPYGIVFDSANNLYISQQASNNIIKVAPGSLVRTTFASGFKGPRHLSKDKFDNIYVADYGNNAIKRISPAGKVTTVLSTGLNSPRQVAFDASGNLLVADYGTNSIVKSTAACYSINAPLPAGLVFNTTTGQITGQPTEIIAATKYTITAYNTSGSSTANITISVNAVTTRTTSLVATSSIAPTAAVDSSQNAANEKITVNQALSPNGDGVNDVFIIDGLENYLKNKVTIYDHNGLPVYNAFDYNNKDRVFDGRSSIDGRLQKAGTYYYVIEYTASDGGKKSKTGYLLLK